MRKRPQSVLEIFLTPQTRTSRIFWSRRNSNRLEPDWHETGSLVDSGKDTQTSDTSVGDPNWCDYSPTDSFIWGVKKSGSREPELGHGASRSQVHMSSNSIRFTRTRIQTLIFKNRTGDTCTIEKTVWEIQCVSNSVPLRIHPRHILSGASKCQVHEGASKCQV